MYSCRTVFLKPVKRNTVLFSFLLFSDLNQESDTRLFVDNTEYTQEYKKENHFTHSSLPESSL
jgi:hypothetical protein